MSTAGLPVSGLAGVARDYRFRPNRPVFHPDSAPALTVVVPVYNEQESLPELIDGLFAALDRLDSRSEVIFVDDGSSDDSFAVLRRESLRRHEPESNSFPAQLGTNRRIDGRHRSQLPAK